MRTSDEIGRTTTNKTSNTEHLLHGDHQIFKYFTGPPMESKRDHGKQQQPKRKKESRKVRRRSKKSKKWKRATQ